jgi:PilZ domain
MDSEENNMPERRKYPRKDLLLFANVYDSASGHIIGTLLNITLDGAMILSENRIDSNKDMTLHIKLPESFTQKQELVFNANSRWCAPDINPEFFDVGYQFVNVSEDDRKIIQSIIEKYGFKE